MKISCRYVFPNFFEQRLEFFNHGLKSLGASQPLQPLFECVVFAIPLTESTIAR